jgi:hypothetical protein
MVHESDIGGQRSAFLSIMLTVLAVSFFLFVAFVSCGGLVLYALAVVAGLGVFGYLHYFLWGQALSAEVAGEREEKAIRERNEAEPLPDEPADWTPEERSWYRRF